MKNSDSDKSTSVKILSRETFSSLVERISTGVALATMEKNYRFEDLPSCIS